MKQVRGSSGMGSGNVAWKTLTSKKNPLTSSLPPPNSPKSHVSIHHSRSVTPRMLVFNWRKSHKYSPDGTAPVSHAGAAQSPSPFG